LYLGDSEDDALRADGSLTWYDSRAAQPHRSAEYRLYVPDNDVYNAAVPGDLLVIGAQTDGTLLVLIVKAGSTYDNQVRWLFGLQGELPAYAVQPEDEGRHVGFAERFILDELGVVAAEPEDDWLDALLAELP